MCLFFFWKKNGKLFPLTLLISSPSGPAPPFSFFFFSRPNFSPRSPIQPAQLSLSARSALPPLLSRRQGGPTCQGLLPPRAAPLPLLLALAECPSARGPSPLPSQATHRGSPELSPRTRQAGPTFPLRGYTELGPESGRDTNSHTLGVHVEARPRAPINRTPRAP